MILGSGLHEKSLNMLGNCKALGMVENPIKQKTLFFCFCFSGGGGGGDGNVDPPIVFGGNNTQKKNKFFFVVCGGGGGGRPPPPRKGDASYGDAGKHTQRH
jgi:hypothetical protein